MHAPRFDDQHQAGECACSGQPLLALDTLAQNRPGDQQRPDGHGKDQYRCLAGAAFHERPGLKQHEARHLRQTYGECGSGSDQLERPAHEFERKKQSQRTADTTFCRESEGRCKAERLLGQYPGVSPCDGEYKKAEREQPAIAGK